MFSSSCSSCNITRPRTVYGPCSVLTFPLFLNKPRRLAHKAGTDKVIGSVSLRFQSVCEGTSTALAAGTHSVHPGDDRFKDRSWFNRCGAGCLCCSTPGSQAGQNFPMTLSGFVRCQFCRFIVMVMFFPPAAQWNVDVCFPLSCFTFSQRRTCLTKNRIYPHRRGDLIPSDDESSCQDS